MKIKLNCMVCGKEFFGEEPKMCCSGRDCGCHGAPVDPIVCSKRCYKLLPGFKNREDKPTESDAFCAIVLGFCIFFSLMIHFNLIMALIIDKGDLTWIKENWLNEQYTVLLVLIYAFIHINMIIFWKRGWKGMKY